MTKAITLVHLGGNRYGVPTKKPHRDRPKGERTCPRWLREKYQAFRPHYKFANADSTPAELEQIKLHSTGEFVGVYFNRIYTTGSPSDRRIERYTWVWRNGKMVQLTQSGGNCGWRPLKGQVLR